MEDAGRIPQNGLWAWSRRDQFAPSAHAEQQRVGFDAKAVDWKSNQCKPEACCIDVDLTTGDGQELVMEMLAAAGVVYVHLAPPCGTASRARERPISKAKQMLGAPNPVPLRTDKYPAGLPGLQGTDLVRVTSANTLYSFTARVISFA